MILTLLDWGDFFKAPCGELLGVYGCNNPIPRFKNDQLKNNSVNAQQEGGNYSVTYTVSDPQVILVGFFLEGCVSSTLPETNMAPENTSLEKEIPIGNHHF